MKVTITLTEDEVLAAIGTYLRDKGYYRVSNLVIHNGSLDCREPIPRSFAVDAEHQKNGANTVFPNTLTYTRD